MEERVVVPQPLVQRAGGPPQLVKRHVKRWVRREIAVPGHPFAHLADCLTQLLGELA